MGTAPSLTPLNSPFIARQETARDTSCCIQGRRQSLTESTMFLHSACSCAIPCPAPSWPRLRARGPHFHWQLLHLCSPDRKGAPGMYAPRNSTNDWQELHVWTPALVFLDVSYPGQKAGTPMDHSDLLLLTPQPRFIGRLPSHHLTFPHLPAGPFSRFVGEKQTCVIYFSVSVRKHQDQKQLREASLLWCMFWRDKSPSQGAWQ